MKKRNLACLALAAPFLALTACSGGMSSLALSANWYAQVDSTIQPDTNETLSYAVSFEAAAENTFLSYGEGTYTMHLTTETTGLADGTSDLCYHLHAELSVPVTFTVNGETESFTDSVISDVYFHGSKERLLQPVRSEKYVLTHSPVSASPSSLEGAYSAYEYTYMTTYDASCANADIKIEFTQPEDVNAITDSVELTGSGTYLDNEEIIFAMRGVSMSSTSAFRSINPVKRAVETVTMSEAPASASERLTFSLNGESAEREITTYTFSLGYSGSNPGQPQTYTYAGVTSANDNLYRSALLRMEVPVLYSLGTLRYTLVSAVF